MKNLGALKQHNRFAKWFGVKKSQLGLSLIEMAISMVLMLIMGVGATTLMASGIQSQMAYRVHEYLQTATLNIIDRIRLDLMVAENISVTNGGLGLSFTSYTLNPSGDAVTWNLSNGKAIRNRVELQNSPDTRIRFQVSCGSTLSCFVLNSTNGVVNSVTLNEFRLVHQLNGAGSQLDQQFGAAQYRINEYSFSVLTGKNFQ